jgi:hypothetical protein
MSDRRVGFGTDVGRNDFLHAAGTDEKVDLEAGGRRPDHGEIFSLAADERADDWHRMVHGAEAPDDHHVAVLDESDRFILSDKHLFARRPIGAGDRIELHHLSSSLLNHGGAQHAIGIDFRS